jgi:nuclear pore complex protein Nup205
VVASETVHRQHRVLITALQLLVRILASPTRSGVAHASSFLNAHRESLLVLLRENVAYVTPTGIDESRLIIALLCMIVPKAMDDEKTRKSSFNAFYHAVLALAAKFFDPSWSDSIHDADEDGETINSKVLALNQVVIAYLCATTAGLKGGNGQPVFVIGTARPLGAKGMGTAPTLMSAVDLVATLAEDAQDLSAAYDDVAEKLEAGEPVEIRGFDAESVEELQAAFAQRTAEIYNMIESLLLLIWRHMLYWVKDAGGESVVPDRLSLSFSTATASRLGAGAGAVNLKALERVAASLRGVLDRLDDVDPSSAAAATGRTRDDAYHAMLVRRLRELCAGLVGE